MTQRKHSEHLNRLTKTELIDRLIISQGAKFSPNTKLSTPPKPVSTCPKPSCYIKAKHSHGEMAVKGERDG